MLSVFVNDISKFLVFSSDICCLLFFLNQSFKMKTFIDVFSGEELCSDAYPIKLVDDVYYEVEGKV